MKLARSINRRLLPGNLLYGPHTLVLGVNNICNLHCKMCDVGTGNLETNFATNLMGTHPLHMPLDLFQRIIDQAEHYFPDTKIGYAFTEPLVYKHLAESLEYASFKNRHTTLTTNGLNLKQKADQLIKGGLKELYISLDGPEAIHNQIRGHKSSYQRALEGIEAILSQSNIPVSVFCVITEWNIGFLRTFIEELQRFPLHHVGFMHSNFITGEQADLHNQLYAQRYSATTSDIEQVNFSAFDLDVLSEELNHITQTNYPFHVSISPHVTNLPRLKDYYLHPEKKVGTKCLDVFNMFMIKSDGSVIPAHGRCFNKTAGNVYTDSLKTIWNSKVLSDLRKDLIRAGGTFPACNRCCSAILPS